MDPAAVIRRTFRAMGTNVTAVMPDTTPPWIALAAEAAVRDIFAEQEQRFSRFRADSELSRVNRAAGSPTTVSADFAEVAHLALEAFRRTGGAFDPTTLHALVNAGYDRDLDAVRAAGPRHGKRLHPVTCERATDVSLSGRTLTLPPDVGLDFGGIAKGWTADRAAERAAEILDWALVDAGGDLRIAGRAPIGGLPISVEDPAGGDTPLLHLTQGALATSSILKRTWAPGRHHVIEPRTGVPARADYVQATAWAPTAAEAEVAATWVLLRGVEAMDHVRALAFRSNGDLFMNLEAA